MDEIIPGLASEPRTRLSETCPSAAAAPDDAAAAATACGQEAGIGSPALWNKTIELHCDRPEALRIRSRSIADAVVAEIAAPPVTVTQDRSAGKDPHRFHVVLLLEGRGAYRWADGAVTQFPGDVVLVDTAEPSQVVSPVDSRLLRWSLPESVVAPFLPAGNGRPVLHLPGSAGLTTVLARHACELARVAEQLDRDTQHGLLGHLCGLLGLAIEAERKPRPARRCTYRSHQRQRILTYVETHLHDCHLTAGRTARELGMSPRWLHALLEDTGCGFAELVARRRLEKCRSLLEDPASEHLSIAEIAFLSGFNDLSTFYRRFGDRYKATPGEVRRTRRAA